MFKNLAQPGYYSYDACTIIDDERSRVHDISDIIKGLSISESVHKQNLSINITLSDQAGLLSEAELYGNEIIVISYKTPNYHKENKLRELAFRITDIQNVEFTSNLQGLQYQIRGVHELSYIQEFGDVRNHFSGKISDAAQKIFDEAVGLADNLNKPLALKEKCTLDKDETDGNLDFIIPSETSFDSITYLESWAFSNESKSNYFMFFQTPDDFKFRNLSSLIKDGKDKLNDALDLKNRTYYYDLSEGTTASNAQKKFNYCYDLVQLNRNNFYLGAKDGGYHNAVNKVDYTFKKVTRTTKKVDFKELNYFKNDGFLAGQKALDSFLKEPNTTDWIYHNGGQSNSIEMAPQHHTKMILSYTFFNNMIQITIPGNSDLQAGEVIVLRIPAVQHMSEGEKKLDNTLSGEFFIKDINHVFTPQSYVDTLTLCRVGGDWNA